MCDQSATRSIIRFNDEQDKIFRMDSHMAMASIQKKGGDSAQFSEYIQKNLKLYQLKTGTQLSTHAASNFVRGELARYLRQRPYYVDLLIGGYDSEGPSLYYLDYLSSMQKMQYAAHGYAGYFVTATIDRYYTPGLSRSEGMVRLFLCCVTSNN
jgi:20S proteasome subunit beta 4